MQPISRCQTVELWPPHSVSTPYASDPHPPAAAPAADVHHRRGAHPGDRHWRQRRHLQRDRGCAAQAAALSAAGPAGGARSLSAGAEPAAHRRRAVSLLHLPRGRPGVSGRRDVDRRHGQRHRHRGARGGPRRRRHRRPAADVRRDAGARPPVHEAGRLARRGRYGDPHGRLLAIPLRRRSVGRRAPHHAGRQGARDHRRAARLVPVPRSEAIADPSAPVQSRRNSSRQLQLHRRRASEAGRHARSGDRRRDAADSRQPDPFPGVPRFQRQDVRGREAASRTCGS